ncbi:hypothetical protein NADFUDRAFT_83739 [Nadsonia fulvescens var. elongata DSM 6958]|uniref:Thioredoxin domain-containing protein n=1 Tax=Nadsonia fulvescens var. elongata DSM 6958 TaxID=857566 RepID=A0A1E3PFI4_9ASCO|nr:hypothetical protein NADFUDRAFT_83739 [Nadsonia fulvescens var. elongata DSM 6958]
MKLWFLIWGILGLLVSLIHADESQNQQDVQVPKMEPIILTADIFNAAITRGTWLVKFFSPYCPHCVKMAPEYQAAFEAYVSSDAKNNGDFHFASVDCVTEGDLCQRMGISVYPSLRIYDFGILSQEYGMKEPRKRDDLLEFAKKAVDQKLKDKGFEPDLNVDSKDGVKYTVKNVDASPLNPDGMNVVLTPESFNSNIFLSIDDWVVRFTNENLDDENNKASGTVRPENVAWSQMASVMRGQIRVGSLNCHQYRQFCEETLNRRFSIDEAWYHVGTRTVKYPESGPITDGSKLIEFAHNAVENRAMPHLNERDFDKALKRQRIGSEESYTTFLYLFDDMWFDEDFAALEQFAVGVVGRGYVYKSNSSFLAKRYSITQFPALLALRESGSVTDAYPESTLPQRMRDMGRLLNWANDHYLPLFAPITPSTIDAILCCDRMVVLVAVDPSHESFQRTRSEIKSTIGAYRLQRARDDQIRTLALRDQKQAKINDLKRQRRPNAGKIEQATMIKVEIEQYQPVQFAWVDITAQNSIRWKDEPEDVPLNEKLDPETGAAVLVINGNTVWRNEPKKPPILSVYREVLLDIIPKTLGVKPALKGAKVVLGKSNRVKDQLNYTILSPMAFFVVVVLFWRLYRRRRLFTGSGQHRMGTGQGLLDGKLE